MVLDKCLSHEDARDFLLCWLELPKLILYPSRNSYSSNSRSQSMVHVHWKSHGWESHLRVVTALEGHKGGIYLVRESHCHLGFFFLCWQRGGLCILCLYYLLKWRMGRWFCTDVHRLLLVCVRCTKYKWANLPEKHREQVLWLQSVLPIVCMLESWSLAVSGDGSSGIEPLWGRAVGIMGELNCSWKTLMWLSKAQSHIYLFILENGLVMESGNFMFLVSFLCHASLNF